MDNDQQISTKSTLRWSDHFKESVVLGLPLVGAQLAQMLINTTDIVMLGWLGTEELAAGVLATQTLFVLYILGAGIGFASMPLASQAVGRDDLTGLRRAIRMGCWVSVIYGLATMPILMFTEEILLLLRQDPKLAAMAGDYMDVALWGMVPALLFPALRSFYSTIDRAGLVLLATVIGVITNIVLNYAFIFGNFGAPALGIVGAAVASLGTNCLIALLVVVFPFILRGFEKYELFARIWRADWPVMREIVVLGWPIGIAILAEVGLFVAASVFMGWIGTVELAAHGIAIQLASIAFMIPLGLSNVATVRVGNAYGSSNYGNIIRAAFAVSILTILVGITAGIFFWSMPETLVSLFLDETNDDVAAVTVFAGTLVLVAAAFQLVDGLQAVAAGVLRGLSDTRVPMILAVCSYWLFGLGTGYYFAFQLDLGGLGVWIGLALGLTVAAILLCHRFWVLVNRLNFS